MKRECVGLDRDMIQQIDQMVGEEHRDEFVATAVRAEIRRLRMEALKQVVGSLKDVDTPGWETPEAAAQWVHDSRYHPEKLLDYLKDKE